MTLLAMESPAPRSRLVVYARVERHVIAPGAVFPHCEYLRLATPDDPWTLVRTEGDVFTSDEADNIARKLSTREVHVFPVILQGKHDPAMPARSKKAPQGQDWHQGKPNCGVD